MVGNRKVYCGDCEYFRDYHGHGPDVCEAPQNGMSRIVETHKHRYRTYDNREWANAINAKNDCGWFVPMRKLRRKYRNR